MNIEAVIMTLQIKIFKGAGYQTEANNWLEKNGNLSNMQVSVMPCGNDLAIVVQYQEEKPVKKTLNSSKVIPVEIL